MYWQYMPLTCAQLNHQPQVVACLVPFVELHHINMVNLMSQTNLQTRTQIGTNLIFLA